MEGGVNGQKAKGNKNGSAVWPHVRQQPSHELRVVYFSGYFLFHFIEFSNALLVWNLATSGTEAFVGALVVDKPTGCTSHDVVNRVRQLTGTRKVGHLGTLDPIATGVLPVLVGPATRLAQFFIKTEKAYEATVRFGHSTDTYDADGEPTSPDVPVVLSEEVIRPRLEVFRGKIQQIPPPVSAKKIGGTPAYKLARKKVDFKIDPVEVEVYAIELLRCEGREVDIRVRCSAGTYIRAIAHDLGQALGTGAILTALRRTSSGVFGISAARTLEELVNLRKLNSLETALIPAAKLLPEFPTEVVNDLTAALIRQGRDFQTSPFQSRHEARYVKAVSQDGHLLAIGEAKLPLVYHPILVL